MTEKHAYQDQSSAIARFARPFPAWAIVHLGEASNDGTTDQD